MGDTQKEDMEVREGWLAEKKKEDGRIKNNNINYIYIYQIIKSLKKENFFIFVPSYVQGYSLYSQNVLGVQNRMTLYYKGDLLDWPM